jgi:hypothetical protein
MGCAHGTDLPGPGGAKIVLVIDVLLIDGMCLFRPEYQSLEQSRET